MFRHSMGWKHDKVYIKGLQIKGKLKLRFFWKQLFKKIFKKKNFIMKSFFFCIEFNIHWLQNLRNFSILKVKKCLKNWMVKIVFKSTFSLKKSTNKDVLS
jgi:hypothetical protein